MANYYLQLANYLVTPTEADHHGDDYGAGAGLVLYEPLWTITRHAQGGSINRVISGFTLPSSGNKDTATITAGSAVIAGYLVTGTDNVTPISFSGSASPVTTYVYLTLVTAGSPAKVTYPLFQLETTRIVTPTKYNLLLGSVTANATTITSAADMRVEGRHLWGSVLHSDAGTPTVENYGSGNWVPSRSGARTVITFDNAFLFRAPTVIVSSDNGLASNYATSTTTATIDGTNAVVFHFHIMG